MSRGALCEAIFLLVLAASLGLANHLMFHRGSPLFHSVPPVGDFPTERLLSVADASARQQQGKALFVDARSPELFAYGHLPDAISIPVDGTTSPEKLELLRSAPVVITYCDGKGCDAALRLAQRLESEGIKGVSVMPGGWSGWLAAGLPIVLAGK